jgi:hypothetical protein
MPGPVAGLIGSAVIGAGASIFGANKAADSQKKAAKKQAKLTKLSLAQQKEALERQIALQEPFRQVGVNALAKYPEAAAPSYTPFGMPQFQTDPGYNFRMSEGVKALERSAAARGLLSSGSTLKGITQYGQNVASDEYQNAFNRYLLEQTKMREERMAPLEYQIGLGQAAASGQAANIGTTAGQTSQLMQNLGDIQAQRGNVQAAQYMGTANALGNVAQAVGGYYANEPYMNYLRSITPSSSVY